MRDDPRHCRETHHSSLIAHSRIPESAARWLGGTWRWSWPVLIEEQLRAGFSARKMRL